MLQITRVLLVTTFIYIFLTHEDQRVLHWAIFLKQIVERTIIKPRESIQNVKCQSCQIHLGYVCFRFAEVLRD